MTTIRSLRLLATLAAVVMVGPAAQADTVTFVTNGFFNNDPAQTSYIAPGEGGGIVQINYNFSTTSVNANPTSNVGFGTIDTSLTTAVNPTSVAGVAFTLQIFQIAPIPTGDNMVTFVGQLNGTLESDSSGAYLQFNPAELQMTIASEGLRNVTYSIISADDNNPGRVSLNSPTYEVPGTDPVQRGITVINGRITVAAIPEPSAVVLMGLGAPLMLLYRLRRTAAAA